MSSGFFLQSHTLLQVDTLTNTRADVTASLRLANAEEIANKPLVKNHCALLLIFDMDNQTCLSCRI